MRDVCVLGIGQTVFGKHKGLYPSDLGAYAANVALHDAALSPKELQMVFCGSLYSPLNTAQAVMLRVGCSRIPMYNVENACASGSCAVDLLWRLIALDAIDVGMAIGVESLTQYNRKNGKGLLGIEGDQNAELGLVMPGFFAYLYQRLMETRGATLEDLCYPSVKNHRNSVNNPLSQYHEVFTYDEIMASPTISYPITTLQCCPQSDGGAAVILCSEAYYRRHNSCPGRPIVRIASSVISNSGPENTDFDPVMLPCLIDGAKKAYEEAGIGPEDLDCVELHDAFSGEELAAYEMLGLCSLGEGVAFARSGGAEIGGRCAVNPSGGLLSMGHPLGASGVRVVNDVTRQLWGEAGGTQVPNAKVGLAQMLGGVLTGFENPVIAGLQVLKR